MKRDAIPAKSGSIFIVTGQVQGVGFRPHVYRLALECGLCGSVRNTERGVRIEAQGDALAVDRFALRLRAELPPLARIASLEREDVPYDPALPAGFAIETSARHGGAKDILVSPDIAMCDRCLADLLTPGDRRYGYAFTNAGAVEVVKAGAVKGAFDKNIDLQFPTDSEVIFEVHAEGEWAINAN